MVLSLLKRFFIDSPDRKLDEFREMVTRINALEEAVSRYSESDFLAKAQEFRAQIAAGKAIEDLLPDVFAMVREAARRTINMRHFDVQLLGGIALHRGYIAEMKTGEGKTLVATLPITLNALTGKGVHLVTVNDYLARRDSEWMGPVYRYMGLSVGTIQNQMTFEPRRAAYACDVTYGTNNEFGFDYLRDNMATSKEHLVQRKLNYAIVDEVDSILIDEARTPLIISGVMEEDSSGYQKADSIARRLQKEKDFTLDEKTKNVVLTDDGLHHAESELHIESLYDMENMDLAHQIVQALRAHHAFKLDVDYVNKDGEIVIVDEFTGRLMVGRRYSDGLHQAIEAKERVEIREESQTLATITFQNYFRMYKKIAGMTGTAMTEEAEFDKIYHLDVLTIPTHHPMIRKDENDLIYKTKKEKFAAVVDEIAHWHAEHRPVLVGTTSIENSETLSDMLKRRGTAHQVLNAKYHEREAEIIALAGQKDAVTIATNMAGRGTDIVLGDGVAALGGLHVIGTERHESRRIDNQLRGRTGRQGDQGSTRFYVALDDDLMRLFGGDRMAAMMNRLGVEEGTPIEHSWITKSIENAQHKVEEHHFSVRKQLLEYDDVMNRQRSTIYALRRRILEGDNVSEKIWELIQGILTEEVDEVLKAKGAEEESDLVLIRRRIEPIFAVPVRLAEDVAPKNREEWIRLLRAELEKIYQQRTAEFGEENIHELERMLLLRSIDQKWIEHLKDLDILKDGIGLRAYGQRDPLVEYKIEGYALFQAMMGSIARETVNFLFRVEVKKEEGEAAPKIAPKAVPALKGPKRLQLGAPKIETSEPVHRGAPKVGRNDPCPCGSGKKYKKCHGAA